MFALMLIAAENYQIGYRLMKEKDWIPAFAGMTKRPVERTAKRRP